MRVQDSHGRSVDVDQRINDAARFVPCEADVMQPRGQDRPAGEKRVSVMSEVPAQRVPGDGSHAERLGEEAQLHGIAALAWLIVDFLQSEGVAIERAERIGNPSRVLPKIRADTAVNVVRSDAQHAIPTLMSSSRLAIAQLVLVMLLWGSTFVVTKAALEGLPPVLFAFARTGVAAVCLLLLAVFKRQWRLPSDTPRGILVTMAVFGIAIYYTAFNLGLRYTSAAQAALVQSSLPAVTTAFAMLFLREQLKARGALGILLAIGGVAMIFAQSAPSPTADRPILGNLIMFCGVIAWSAYTVLARRLAGIEPLTVVSWVTTMGAAALGVGAVIEWGMSTGDDLRLGTGGGGLHLTGGGWTAILYLGLLPSALSFVLYSQALRHLRAAQVAVFINLVPVVGVLAGVVFLGDALSSSALLGGGLVLAGVWLSTRSD